MLDTIEVQTPVSLFLKLYGNDKNERNPFDRNEKQRVANSKR